MKCDEESQAKYEHKTNRVVLAFGRSFTKVLPYFLTCSKTYVVTAELGKATSTYDTSGEVTQTAPYQHIAREAMEQVMAARFQGPILQSPPIYSALRVSGARAYDLARQGRLHALPPRPVTIHSLSLLSFHPPYFSFLCQCSSGTYVRAVAHDLGQALQSCAHVLQIQRTHQGNVSLEDALSQSQWTVSDMEAAIQRLTPRLLPAVEQWRAQREIVTPS
eukprot:TRINITY_DN3785_c0_g1_i1.p1 TRINITY_DN3785_c0_g1~~TRINITY_DN3785_c0_g1_i1.p1  ORF type:complete len:219 (-),score=35.22 TRINITY_DN3785_c0_g1_i1:33-689(-)